MRRRNGENKRHGLVMEIGDDHAILATPDLQFVRVPLSRLQPGAREGEEAWFRPTAAPRGRALRGRVAAAVAVCVAASLLLFALSPPLLNDRKADRIAVAHLVLDINPSVEMAIDGNGHVIDAWGLNEAGFDLLGQLGWQDRHVMELLEDVVAKASGLGYLDPENSDNTILISLIGSDESADIEGFLSAVEIGDSIRRYLELIAGDHPAPSVGAWDVLPEEREEADRLGLSPNCYLVLQGLQQAGVEIDPDDLKDQPLGQVISSSVGPQGISVSEFVKGQDNRPGPPPWAGGPPHVPPGHDKDEDTGRPDTDTPPGQDKDREPGPPHVPPGHDRDEDTGRPGTPPGQDKDREPGPPHVPPGHDKNGDTGKPVPPGQDNGREPGPPHVPPGHDRG